MYRRGSDFMIKPDMPADTQYNAETEQAMLEAKSIIDGKIEAKAYKSAKELFNELDNECCSEA